MDAGLDAAPDTGTICLVFRLDGDRVGSGAVAKEFIARHDLERIALQEIRAFPGCEHVTDVEIEHQIDRASKQTGLCTSILAMAPTWSASSTR